MSKSIDKTDSVGADLLLHQVHNGLAHHGHVLGLDVTRGQKLAGLLVDLVECKQVRQISHGGLGGWGQLHGSDTFGLGHITTNAEDEVLDENQLTMGHRGVVNLNKHRVPGPLLDIEGVDNLSHHVGGTVSISGQLDLRVVELCGSGGGALELGVVQVGVQVGESRVGDLTSAELAGSALGDKITEGLEEVASSLLSDHVVISLPGDIGGYRMQKTKETVSLRPQRRERALPLYIMSSLP